MGVETWRYTLMRTINRPFMEAGKRFERLRTFVSRVLVGIDLCIDFLARGLVENDGTIWGDIQRRFAVSQ